MCTTKSYYTLKTTYMYNCNPDFCILTHTVSHQIHTRKKSWTIIDDRLANVIFAWVRYHDCGYFSAAAVSIYQKMAGFNEMFVFNVDFLNMHLKWPHIINFNVVLHSTTCNRKCIILCNVLRDVIHHVYNIRSYKSDMVPLLLGYGNVHSYSKSHINRDV